MDSNDIWTKFSVERKEISKNQKNSIEFFDIAYKCGLVKNNSADIPLLWTGEKCVSGDVNIIDYFKTKL
jgi:hypothetical protein